ncbi:MAG: hypothetical protein HYT94_03130, partial [Parcubacteria group bacterium]|nr:hypothetical protein [Parcubacteria group bacterium]
MKESFPQTNEKAITAEKLNFQGIEKLRMPMENIVRQISPQIEAGEYQLIIGDDASGRIPALIMKKIIGAVYKEHKFPLPKTAFIAGSRDLEGWWEKNKKQKRISDYFGRMKKDIIRESNNSLLKALVVTEVIQTGKSLDPIIIALKKHKIDFDVVSAGLCCEPSEIVEIGDRFGKKVIYGTDEFVGGLRSSFSGVIKSSQDLFSRRSVPDYTTQRTVNVARE